MMVLFVFADPLMELMYNDNHAAVYITFLAPICIFIYYQMPLQAILQALNLANAAMINSLIGAVVKLGLIFLLSSQPQLGIMGTAIGIAASTVLITFLHFATISKRITLAIEIKDYLLTIIITILSGWLGHIIYRSISHSFSLYIAIALSCAFFLLLSILFKVITINELSAFNPFRKRKWDYLSFSSIVNTPWYRLQ